MNKRGKCICTHRAFQQARLWSLGIIEDVFVSRVEPRPRLRIIHYATLPRPPPARPRPPPPPRLTPPPRPPRPRASGPALFVSDLPAAAASPNGRARASIHCVRAGAGFPPPVPFLRPKRRPSSPPVPAGFLSPRVPPPARPPPPPPAPLPPAAPCTTFKPGVPLRPILPTVLGSRAGTAGACHAPKTMSLAAATSCVLFHPTRFRAPL